MSNYSSILIRESKMDNVKTNVLNKYPNTIQSYGLMAAMNPLCRYTSASRGAMINSHFSQAISPLMPDIARISTGFEQQLAKHVTNVKMPVDGIVVAIMRRYKVGLGSSAIGRNPCVTIIYQELSTGRFDYIDIREYMSRHIHFGNRMVISEYVSSLTVGASIPEGVVLAESPNVAEGGIYSNTVSANYAYTAMPGVIEDGFIITEGLANKLSPLEMSECVMSWGKNKYPLNLYGDADNYKPFPDIGETIRPDGLVACIRSYDDELDGILMSKQYLSEVDTVLDRTIYGTPGAIVDDITVESGLGESRKRKYTTPDAMSIQPNKYINNLSTYYDEIVKWYGKLYSTNKNVSISPRLQNLVVRAIADKPNDRGRSASMGNTGTIHRTYKNEPLDEFRVTITMVNRKNIAMSKGSKITGKSGDKGVVCSVIPDSEAPRDSTGRVIELQAFAKGAVSRLNPDQLYEQYVNSVSERLTTRIREMVGKVKLSVIWELLMGYYKEVSKTQYNAMIKGYVSDSDKQSHIDCIVAGGIYIVSPANDFTIDSTIIERLGTKYPPKIGKMTYTDPNGKRIESLEDVVVGERSIMMLEKTAQNPSAVSSSSLQHHGLLSGGSRASRDSRPIKVQAVRASGETEVRLFLGCLGGEYASEILDLNNNPDNHRVAVRTMLEADNVSNIGSVIDRSKFPSGNSRVHMLIRSIYGCMGTGIQRVPNK